MKNVPTSKKTLIPAEKISDIYRLNMNDCEKLSRKAVSRNYKIVNEKEQKLTKKV